MPILHRKQIYKNFTSSECAKPISVSSVLLTLSSPSYLPLLNAIDVINTFSSSPNQVFFFIKSSLFLLSLLLIYVQSVCTIQLLHWKLLSFITYISKCFISFTRQDVCVSVLQTPQWAQCLEYHLLDRGIRNIELCNANFFKKWRQFYHEKCLNCLLPKT